MAVLKVRSDAASPRRFAIWSLALWVLLLLAGYAGLQYMQHGEFVYLAATFVVIVICVAAIMRHEWARSAMRATTVVLALYALVSGVAILVHWGDFDKARQAALAQPQTADLALFMIERTRRTFQVVLGLKAIAIPLLLWLGWVLGQPPVRSQFHRRDMRFSKR
ncbi:hypothetical protein [Dyella sp.]|uniref:hypothetical protein n=1 Tax=Dyella sp. TaxID=1869338 RepID=UPI002ED1FB84